MPQSHLPLRGACLMGRMICGPGDSSSQVVTSPPDPQLQFPAVPPNDLDNRLARQVWIVAAQRVDVITSRGAPPDCVDQSIPRVDAQQALPRRDLLAPACDPGVASHRATLSITVPSASSTMARMIP
jgi:hypothetical protein